MRTRRGITLIELLVTLAITAVVATALARAFYVVVHYELTAPSQQQAYLNKVRFEERLQNILQAVYLSPTATDQTTYLIGTVQGQNPNGQPNLTDALAAPGTAAATAPIPSTTDAQSAITNGSADGIVFTVLGRRISPIYLQISGVSLTDDGNGGNNSGPTGGSQNFEPEQSLPNGQTVLSDLATLNQSYGAQGGTTEVAISPTPVGTPGQFSGDVYIRTQTPSDADYTQGGAEQVFDPNVSKMQFEFYDGLQWDGGWDTTSTGGRYLPAAIRVHYWMKDDPNTENIFVVRLPLSTLTPELPLSTLDTTTTTSTSTSTTGAGGRPGGTGGGGGGGGTGATGRSGVIGVLPGSLPLFSNLEIVPDNEAPETVVPLDPKKLLAPNGLSANMSPGGDDQLTPSGLQPWQSPPNQFSFYPQQDPLSPPPSPPPTSGAKSPKPQGTRPSYENDAEREAKATSSGKDQADRDGISANSKAAQNSGQSSSESASVVGKSEGSQ